MRRAPANLWRWIGHAAGASLLVLTLFAIALWVRGYYVWDAVRFRWHPHTVGGQNAIQFWGSIRIEHDTGRWYVEFQPHDSYAEPRYRTRSIGDDPQFPDFADEIRQMPGGLGFHVGDRFAQFSPIDLEHWACAPDWAAVTPLALLSARWLWVVHIARQRRRAGACPDCGYDLRESPSVCPECGAPTFWPRP